MIGPNAHHDRWAFSRLHPVSPRTAPAAVPHVATDMPGTFSHFARAD